MTIAETSPLISQYNSAVLDNCILESDHEKDIIATTDNNIRTCRNMTKEIELLQCKSEETDKSTNISQISFPKSIHYGAVAYGCAFFVGVHYAFEEMYGSNFHLKMHSFHGDSAGVFFALGMALGKSAGFMDNLYRSLSIRVHKEGISHTSAIVSDALDMLLDDPNAYKRVENRLSIGVTEFPLHHKRYSSFNDNNDLRQCLLGSMYLPLYCDLISPVRGKFVIDGGFSFSGYELIHGNDTIFIGIDPNAEVSGELSLLEMAFPMIDEKYNSIVDMGRHSLHSWCANPVLKDKLSHRKKNPVGLVMWPLFVISYFISVLRLIASYFVVNRKF